MRKRTEKQERKQSNTVFNEVRQFAYYRLSKNHWRQVVKWRGHTLDAKADKNHWCSVKTWCSKASLQSQDAGLKARFSTSLQSQDAGLEVRLSAELKARVSAQSLKPASQMRSSTQSLKPVFQHHCGAQTRSLRPASSVTSTTKRMAQACIPTVEEPCISVITTPLLGQVLPT